MNNPRPLTFLVSRTKLQSLLKKRIGELELETVASQSKKDKVVAAAAAAGLNIPFLREQAPDRSGASLVLIHDLLEGDGDPQTVYSLTMNDLVAMDLIDDGNVSGD